MDRPLGSVTTEEALAERDPFGRLLTELEALHAEMMTLYRSGALVMQDDPAFAALLQSIKVCNWFDVCRANACGISLEQWREAREGTP